MAFIIMNAHHSTHNTSRQTRHESHNNPAGETVGGDYVNAQVDERRGWVGDSKHGRVALVTGAAKGLGRSMLLGLLDAGIRVAAVDRDPESLEALRAEVALAGKNDLFEPFVEDLCDFDAESLISRITRKVGSIDVLVNNAGLGQAQVRNDYHRNPPKFYEVTPQVWKNAINVNATAVFLLSRALAPLMIGQGWGRIINITTSLGTMLRAGYCPYGPTKASAEGLSAVMAADLAGTGVTVNVLIPGGVVNTPMIPIDAPFRREELLQPEEMVGPLLWLVSREADHITGRRFLANKWDTSIAAADAAARAGAPIGWKDIAVLPVTPAFVNN